MTLLPPVFGIVDTRREYNRVFAIYVPVGVGVFVFFTLLIVGATLFYRRRRGEQPPGVERPDAKHEANRLEISYAVLLTCVAGFLLYITFSAEHKVDTALATERAAYTVDVTASRWLWHFSYPGHGIRLASGEGAGQVFVVPANTPVRINLTSSDVIHSLWIPQLAFKRDAIPGSTERLTLDFDRTGSFKGACAEYCGTYHAEMVFRVRVVSDNQFNHWLASGGRTFT
ncbi:MAG TPA: cytochrome c oxidase subunit II [Solirubrobacteraceae bacterium]|nr:cytochrome c oxidase subunit II [Solirubrobacteraceae bacterium]